LFKCPDRAHSPRARYVPASPNGRLAPCGLWSMAPKVQQGVASSTLVADAVVVCASCPERFHDQAVEICSRRGIHKAFGKTGDMLNSLTGKDWVAKWETKVVMTVVTAVRCLKVSRARILCIEGGKHCDLENAAQPKLVRAIRQELGDMDFKVRVEWMSFGEFCEVVGASEALNQSAQQAGVAPKAQTQASSKSAATVSAKGGGKSSATTASISDVCKYFREGTCTKGSACPFAHGPSVGAGKGKASANASATSKLCKHFAQGDCTKGSACTFAHVAPPLPPTVNSKDVGGGAGTKLCKLFAEGACTKGSSCPFGHVFGNATKPCKHFAAGKCVEGNACKFSHTARKASEPQPRASRAEEAVAKHMTSTHTSPDKRRNAERRGPSESSEPVWQCSECLREFATMTAVEQHMRSTGHSMAGQRAPSESSEPVWECPECLREFATETAVEQHMRSTGHSMAGQRAPSESSEPVWECPECLREFATETAVEQHMRSTGHEFPACMSCGRCFNSEHALVQHCISKGHAAPVRRS